MVAQWTAAYIVEENIAERETAHHGLEYHQPVIFRLQLTAVLIGDSAHVGLVLCVEVDLVDAVGDDGYNLLLLVIAAVWRALKLDA